MQPQFVQPEAGLAGPYNSFMQGQQDNQTLQAGDLNNQMTQAQIPGVQGASMSSQAKGQADMAQLPDAIAMAKSNALSKMSDNDAKMTTNMGGQISQFGAILDNIPAPARAAAIVQFASKYNMNADSPLIKGLLEAPPEKMPDVVKSLGSNMIQLSTDYVKNSGLIGQKTTGQISVANVKADAQRDVADVRAMSAIDVADLNNASKEKLLEYASNVKRQLQATKAQTTDQLVATRLQAYQENPSDENKQALSEATKIKQAVAQNPQLQSLFQQAAITQTVMPGMPNTIQTPNPDPTTTFNTPTGRGQTPVQGQPTPPATPPAASSQSVQVGTQKGKPVYTSDPANPKDQSKWHY